MHRVLLLPQQSPAPPRFRPTALSFPIPQFQLYAVQRWLVQRRHITLLVVYTGNDAHTITLHAFVPDSPAVWDDTIARFRADGAKPKQTAHGLLMVTSLANFRSDYTIVQIPTGDFPQAKDQLYANINLLRIGSSGRTALTLEDPSDSTKDRFMSAYCLPESLAQDNFRLSPQVAPSTSPSSKPVPPIGLGRPSSQEQALRKDDTHVSKVKDNTIFFATVLELVKLIQAGLAIFGLYPSLNATSVPSDLLLDGLLCDYTVQGMRHWIAHVGGPCVGLEPTERVADPAFVAALFSLILSIRNKLAFLGYAFALPRDPFLYPHSFSLALNAYINSSSPSHHHHQTFTSPHGSVYITTNTNSLSSTANTPLVGTVLTRELIDAINTAYDAKLKAENRKVRRVIKNKLAPGVDSDGAGEGESREQRKHALSLTLSHESSSNISPSHSQPGQSNPNASPSSMGIGSSGGGQLLSGIGSLASGLRLTTGGGQSNGDGDSTGALMVPTLNLADLVSLATSGATSRRERKRREKEKERRRESQDIGAAGGISVALAYEKERDGVVAGTLRALWSGRVMDVIRMREDAEGLGIAERSKDKWKGGRLRSYSVVASDGDESSKDRKYEGRSTEEESDVHNLSAAGGSVHSFGGMWSGRVRGKLGSWAGLTKRKNQSVDLGNLTSLNSTHKGKQKEIEKERDFSPPPAIHIAGSPPGPSRLAIGNGNGSTSNRPSMSRRSTMSGSGPQSPTLPPMVFSPEGDRYPDDDDLLSSGQVSPLSDYKPNPFNMLGSNNAISSLGTGVASAAESSTNLGSTGLMNQQDYERAVAKLLSQKRPWSNRRVPQSARVSSWADPMSAKDVDGGEDEEEKVDAKRKWHRDRIVESEGDETDVSRQGENTGAESLGVRWKRKEKARFHSLLSVVDGEGVLIEEPLGGSDEEDTRRSFHDLQAFHGMEVLTPERMKIDVDICGQLLTMWRREEHLRNVITSTRLIATALAKTNISLREHYETHHETLAQVDAASSVLSSLETERTRSLKILQATNTLQYESAQFHVDDIWQAASPPRRKVFALREKVFGTGGRRLPPGVHGAHGPYNRLQWTLDGRERLVDHLGRTESEAEEENKIEEELTEGGFFVDKFGGPATPGVAHLEEGDVVENPGIKPMWLLRFFTSWGARWSASAGTGPVSSPAPTAQLGAKDEGATDDRQGQLPTPTETSVNSIPPSSDEKWTFVDGEIVRTPSEMTEETTKL
ncbi:hypothetical protein CPB84DRAFT_1840695 [Gymnopilus junonius]|uniref:STB6-like N-terminal domain-containing protein n=1 Tax=Gymnopilus junonius TaxID=109634 RepID=A0A9P5TTS3_GYMJU|nr:hypothetical protein CPB84DRAFT_1840695 [Gymnopilus junonius]